MTLKELKEKIKEAEANGAEEDSVVMMYPKGSQSEYRTADVKVVPIEYGRKNIDTGECVHFTKMEVWITN